MSFKKFTSKTSQPDKIEKKARHQQNKIIEKAFRHSQAYRTRRYNLVRTISLIAFLLLSLDPPLFGLLGLLVDPIWFWILLPVSVLLVLIGAAFLCASPSSPKRLNASIYLLVGGIFWGMVLFQLIIGAFNFSSIAYLFLIVLGALVGLGTSEFIVLTIFCVLMPGGLVVAERVFNVFKPPMDISNQPFFQLFFLASTALVMAISVLILTRSLIRALSESEYQSQKFQQTTQQLLQTNQFGQQVSFSLSSIVSELNATSRQQASGAQEQAAAVMEVTTSLTELGETARQIASNSNRVSTAASEGLKSVSRVKESSERATNTADRGQSAVNSSIGAIEDVRNGITSLAERLMTLTERSRQISSIIALIKEIADETHLLALNAAIESAGSGENGRRFAVVASEVKSLADRSLEATTEVAQVITELQGAVAAAVLASEETRKKTFGAVERSYQAGQVITELGQVVDETAVSSSQIVEAVQQVATLAEEIRLATQQQESAIRQIIGTMEGVGMVAQENASAVSQVSETVSRIDGLSLKLKEALDTTATLTPIAA